MIRVGRCRYENGVRIDPVLNGFEPVLVLMKSSPYYELSPYYLKRDDMIMENIWQFSKVYSKVPNTRRLYSRYNKKVVWEHPAEEHYKDGILTDAYKKWRTKGMKNNEAVRYPVGFDHRTKCLFALKDVTKAKLPDDQLDYIQARKAIYLPEYCDLVVKEAKFKSLKKKLKEGKNILIIEVDAPHHESLDYYKEKYNVGDDFIDEEHTMEATDDNLRIMLNDPKHNFGHGYCLAIALQGDYKKYT